MKRDKWKIVRQFDEKWGFVTDDFLRNLMSWPFLYASGVIIRECANLLKVDNFHCFGIFYMKVLFCGPGDFGKLLKQGYLVKRLKSSFKKFYGRYRDLIH